MEDGAQNVAKLWCSHQEILSQDRYSQMLTQVFEHMPGRTGYFEELCILVPDHRSVSEGLVEIMEEKWSVLSVQNNLQTKCIR